MKFTIASVFAATVASKKAMVGTNIGGWQVLEPWITPSLFYRFLGKTQSEGVGMDAWTLCEALGPDEGNRVMRSHWDAWVTEEHVKGLSERDVEIVRLPIGDWTLKPYGPYEGCMDGAAEKIEWFLDACAKYDIKVLLDVHCLKGSQNGYDNSGMSNRVEWLDEDHFSHWANNVGEWMGPFNQEEQHFEYIYEDEEHGTKWALDNVQKLMDKWGHHPAVYALEPVNEPMWGSDLDVLKQFYRDAREIIRSVNQEVTFTFHDSFHFDAGTWNDLFADDDIENVVLDTHFYQAWWGDDAKGDLNAYCVGYENSLKWTADALKYDVWVGEWALATDVCALWLGGFNDANTFAQYDCEYVDCPKPYLPEETAVDLDRTIAEDQGPFGTGYSDGMTQATIRGGKCAKDSTFFSDE